MCRNNRNPKTSYIWCSIVRVKGVAINLLPEHANIPAIDRKLRQAMVDQLGKGLARAMAKEWVY